MAKKLYVGNLSYNTSESDLQRLFEEFGTVDSAQVISAITFENRLVGSKPHERNNRRDDEFVLLHLSWISA